MAMCQYLAVVMLPQVFCLCDVCHINRHMSVVSHTHIELKLVVTYSNFEL